MPIIASQMEVDDDGKHPADDAGMDQSQQHDGAGEDPKKRDPPVKNSPPRKKSKDAPSLFGYSLKDCGAEGACGYNSLAFAFWLSNNLDKASELFVCCAKETGGSKSPWDQLGPPARYTGKGRHLDLALPPLRSSHMLFRHKGILAVDRGTRINRTEIVESSWEVPEAERDWECPWCHKYLPLFGNYHQKQKNVRRHYRTKHPRRDTSSAAIQKAVSRNRKKDPSSHPKKKSGYLRSAAKRMAKERDLNLGGHKLVAFQPVWSEWPRPLKRKKETADMYFNHLVEEGVEPHPGPETPDGSDEGGSVDDDPDPGGCSSTASPERATQTSFSTARLSVRGSCVNVRDGPGLWRLVKILECDSSFTDIICIQESCIHANEYSTVANKFLTMGFKSYWAEGFPGKKATGGCITVVRSTIPHRVIEIFSGGPHQHIFIEPTSPADP
ncbi:unnamed protein product [Symbiodinium sp. CCMP2592]|nr:unnamed protein product [Symbiodinium sp. CCMP2592]